MSDIDVINVRYKEGTYSLVVRDTCAHCPSPSVERIRQEIERVGRSKSMLNWGAATEVLSPDHYDEIGLELLAYVPFPFEVEHDEILSTGADDDIPF